MNITDNDRELRSRVSVGAAHRWPEYDCRVDARVAEELRVIEERGCSQYFLMASDLVKVIREGGGLVGPGRGACGSSAVCYALGVTDVDPMRYGLLFERFFNEHLKSPRAILIDVDAKGEMAAHRYLDGHFSWMRQLRKWADAPQYIDVEGIGEFGITRTPELDLMAMTLDWLRSSGMELPELGRVEADCLRFNKNPLELCYQEDLMLLAREAGMTPAESDRFRKVLTKRMRDEAMTKRRMFSDELWQRMWACAGDLCMKSHAVCYEKLNQQVLVVKAIRKEI